MKTPRFITTCLIYCRGPLSAQLTNDAVLTNKEYWPVASQENIGLVSKGYSVQMKVHIRRDNVGY